MNIMNLLLENQINHTLKKIFNQLNLDEKFAFVKVSDRPDLSDFQCNGALALAKIAHKNPREIGTMIAEELQKYDIFESISVDGPGFINLKLKNEVIAQNADKMADDERLGCGMVENPHKVILDYGGPNVAKTMHVGHLRSGVIGESVRRIEKFVGNEVIGDVHLGDWGTPMGQILSEIIYKDGNLDKVTSYDIAQITDFYKQANIRCKEDESARENARVITAELQGGNPLYRKAWQHLRSESVKAVKQNYEQFAEVKHYAQGDKPIFRRKTNIHNRNRGKQFVTRVGLAGIYEVWKLGAALCNWWRCSDWIRRVLR